MKVLLKTLLPRFQTLHLEYKVDMKPRYGFGHPPHPVLQSIIEKHREEYAALLKKALTYMPYYLGIPDVKSNDNPLAPVWNNGFLPGLDIIMLYTMIASNAPGKYVEIGSGFSTKVVARAKADHRLNTRIISIDPHPRTEIDMLADEVIRKPFEKTDLGFFSKLQRGDIVFVDNSHRIFPNSDSMVFFMEVLPVLAPGVIVHVHDVYLPYDYPQFMCDRYYSEQYGLAFYLMANPEKYKTLMPNYFVSDDASLSSILDPVWRDPLMPAVEHHGGSYWFMIQS